MPILGIPFYYRQAKRYLAEAVEEDEDYASLMHGLGDEPKFIGHSLKQEWFLIHSTLLALIIVWVLSFIFLFSKVRIEFYFAITSLVALISDYVAGKLALKLFSYKEQKKS